MRGLPTAAGDPRRPRIRVHRRRLFQLLGAHGPGERRTGEGRRRRPTRHPLGGSGSPNQGLALVEDLPPSDSAGTVQGSGRWTSWCHKGVVDSGEDVETFLRPTYDLLPLIGSVFLLRRPVGAHCIQSELVRQSYQPSIPIDHSTAPLPLQRPNCRKARDVRNYSAPAVLLQRSEAISLNLQ